VPNAGIGLTLLLTLGLVPPLIGLGMTTRRITGTLSAPQPAQTAVLVGLLTAAGLLFVGTVPWVLWVTGAIPFYGTALLLVVLLDLALLGGGLTLVWSIARTPAAAEQGTSGRDD
jgi:hypothetical protein